MSVDVSRPPRLSELVMDIFTGGGRITAQIAPHFTLTSKYISHLKVLGTETSYYTIISCGNEICNECGHGRGLAPTFSIKHCTLAMKLQLSKP